MEILYYLRYDNVFLLEIVVSEMNSIKRNWLVSFLNTDE